MQLLFNTFIVHSRQNFISAEMGGGQLTGNVLTRYNILIANAGDEALVFTGQRLSQAHALRLNPRQWAFVGDTVYDLFTRTQILTNTDYPLPKMHNLSVQKVQSSAQAQMLCKIEPILTPMEQDILRRGRKLRTRSSHARNDPGEYAKATALEGLIGFLYLTGQDERLEEIMKYILAEE